MKVTISLQFMHIRILFSIPIFILGLKKTVINASVGTEKVFTVHGINVMNSSENRDSAATPVNAAVTVYDEDGRVVSAMATTTDENGQFVLTFASAGTYTVEISGTCDYTCEAYGGSSGTSYTDATVVPSRCEVVVSGGSGARTVRPAKMTRKRRIKSQR